MLTPYLKYQNYSGGKKHELDAGSIWCGISLRASSGSRATSLRSRVSTRTAIGRIGRGATEQSPEGSLFRLQVQMNSLVLTRALPDPASASACRRFGLGRG